MRVFFGAPRHVRGYKRRGRLWSWPLTPFMNVAAKSVAIAAAGTVTFV